MTGIAPIPQAALMALLKHANITAARPADLSGGGQFQHELLSFQRAGTTVSQASTQLVSTLRPSVFIPELPPTAGCAQGTTPKRGETKKKDKPSSGSGGTRSTAPRR
jgi:hypothetical protein